jgi:protein SCO1/2
VTGDTLGGVPARLRLVLIGGFACALAAIAGVWIAALTAEPEPASGAWAGSLRPPGATVPAFRLRDQDGKVVTPADEVAVYTFIYSTCDDTCPLQVQQIRGALDDLGRDVPVYGISVDPANDTPRRAKSFLLEQSMTGRMRFLLGTREELEPVWKGFGVQPQEDGLEHSAYVVLTDGARRQRIGFPFGALTPDGLLADLRRLTAIS